MTELMTHHGGCHCGQVRFKVLAPAVLKVSQCNCSICAMSGHLGLIVPKDRFSLVAGADHLSEYNFNRKIARHLFCGTCGIKSFYIPRSHPDGVSVDVRCLDPGTVEKLDITAFDGQNWEQNYPQGQAEEYP